MRLRLDHAGMSVPRPRKHFRFSGDMLDCPSFKAAASNIAVTFASWLTPPADGVPRTFTGTTFCRLT
jgi:hypothetical protein